ncbi:MAG: hypothetical protein ACLFVO_19450 [Chloroflexaceae bacterium]
MNTRALLITSAIAGFAMALLSNIPLIAVGNCVICMWLWGGGILGAWLYPRFDEATRAVTPGRGAIIGVVSGLIGALLATLISTLFSGSTAQSIQMALAEMQVTDPQVERMMESLAEPESIILISFLFNIVLYPLFGAIGGAVGGMIFSRSTSDPAV